MNADGDSRRRVVLGLAVTCAVIAGLLGSVGLADASLWLDETFSVFDARRNLGDIFAMRGEAYGGAHHPPGYFLLLKWAIAVCGTSEVCVRGPSVLANAGLAFVLVVLGARLFGVIAGASAGLVWATTPYAIKYAQQARHYTLLALVAAVVMLLLVRALGRDGRRPTDGVMAVLGVVAASGLWLHLFALPFLGALGVVVIAAVVFDRGQDRGATRRQWGIAFGVAALASAPLVPGLWRVWTTGGGGQLASAPGPVENAWPLVVDLATFGLDTIWVPIVCACSLLCPTWRKRGLAIVLALLAALPMSVVFVRNPEHFVTLRYFMPSLVPVALLFGGGIAAVIDGCVWVRGRFVARAPVSVAWMIAALVLATPIAVLADRHDRGLRKQWATAGFEPWRDVAAAIRDAAQAGDIAVLVPHELVEYPLLVYPLELPMVGIDGLADALREQPTGVFVVTSHIDRPERSTERRDAMRAIADAGYVSAELDGVPKQRAIEVLLYRPR